MEKYEISHLNWEGEFFAGGMGTHWRGLSKELAKKHNLHLITPTDKKAKIYSKYPHSTFQCNGCAVHNYKTDNNIDVYSVELPEWRDMLKESKPFNETAYEILKGLEADINHAHDWMVAEAGIKAREQNKTRLIGTIHSTEIKRAEVVHYPCNQEIFNLEKKLGYVADRVIAVSPQTKNVLHYDLSIPKEKITVIGNGIDPEFYNKKIAQQLRKPARDAILNETGWDDDSMIFLHQGRTNRGDPDWKGQTSTILGYAEALAEALPEDPKLKLVMVAAECTKEPYLKPEKWPLEHDRDLGQIERKRWDLINELNNKVEYTGLDLKKNILFLNDYVPIREPREGKAIDRLRIPDFVAASDACIYISIWEDFGIVASEARGMGKPVIATDKTGFAYQIKHGVTGFLITPWEDRYRESGSVAMGRQLALGILLLARDEEFRERIAEAGYKDTMERFTWPIIEQQISEVYEEVINSQG